MAKWIFDLLLIGVVSFVGYVILIGIEKKQIANLVIMIAIMVGLLSTMQDLTPVIKRWSDRIDSIQNTADNIGNFGQGSYTMPMKGEISQGYNDHNHGIDIAAPKGTPVGASRKGDIESIGWNDIYGNVIIIDHGRGIKTVYAHLLGIDTKVGYPVIAGQRIGTCGSTGRSTGPHLHFEIRKNGTCVDPAIYLN